VLFGVYALYILLALYIVSTLYIHRCIYYADTQNRLKVENLLAKYALFLAPYTCSVFASLGNFIVHFDNIMPFLSIFGTLCLPFIYWYFLEARGGHPGVPGYQEGIGTKNT